jgi:sulfate-transporting ATPase
MRASNISVRYGAVHAVNDVSIDVHAGEVVGLIGPNGAGKTSFIDAVTGFARSRGCVHVGEHEVTAARSHERVRAGLARTWQSIELFEDLSVTENIRVGLNPRRSAGASPRHAAPVLERFGLEALAGRLPRQLSNGERKRVGLARALASAPTVLLADEPAAGLDSRESLELGELLRSLVADGLGILLVDHDMGLVLKYCDYLYVVDFGTLIAEGTPAQVRLNTAVRDAYLGTRHDDAWQA